MKMQELLNFNNRINLQEQDYLNLLPLVFAALNVEPGELLKKENIAQELLTISRLKSRDAYQKLAKDGKNTVNEETTILANCNEIIKKLYKDNLLEQYARISLRSVQSQYASKILSNHGNEILYKDDSIIIYKPRKKAPSEDPLIYLDFLEQYYQCAFDLINSHRQVREHSGIKDKLDETVVKRNIEYQKVIEISGKISRLLSIENVERLTPEQLKNEYDKLQHEHVIALQNYQFYVDKIKELQKDLTSAIKKLESIPNAAKRLNAAPDYPRLESGEKKQENKIPTSTDTKMFESVEPVSNSLNIQKQRVQERRDKRRKVISRNSFRKGRRLEVILNDLVKGLNLEKNDVKRYNLSNIEITRSFKEKLHQDNYLYNVTSAFNVGTYLSVPINFINQTRGKLIMTPKARKRIDVLKERIDKLSDDDLMVIFKEYRSERFLQNRDMGIVNTLLHERITHFVESKVFKINVKITNLYKKLCNDYKQIVQITKRLNESITDKERASLLDKKDKLLEGKIDLIIAIERLQYEGRKWYSGGSHGFSEDLKASRTKMGIAGKRFSKDKNTNEKLANKEARLMVRIDKAIARGDNEGAMIAFLKKEKLLLENTKVRKSIYGKRSVGDRYYQPLVTKLNYQDDPFVRDLMSSIATIGGAINLTSALNNFGKVKNQVANANEKILTSNANNRQVGKYAEILNQQSQNVLEGQTAQMYQNELARVGISERYALDSNGWNVTTSTYKNMDHMLHDTYNAAYDQINSSLAGIAKSYSNGTIPINVALQQINMIATEQQRSLISLLSEYQPVLVNYATTSGSKFDLTSLLEATDYVIKHPNAINNMNTANEIISTIGQELKTLSSTGDIEAIKISTTLWPQLAGTTSAYMLAGSISSQMNQNSVNGHYKNAVTKMVSQIKKDDLETLESEYRRK